MGAGFADSRPASPVVTSGKGLRRLRPEKLAVVLHERIMRRDTFAILDLLIRSQHWPTSQLKSLQRSRLRALLQIARAECPYYQSSDYDTADALDDLESLETLPLMTRAILRRSADAMCRHSPPRKRLIDFTHGSTDQRVAYYWDRRRQAVDKANRLRGHAWHGFAPGDRELHVWPLDPPVDLSGRFRAALRSARDRTHGELQIDCLHLDEGNVSSFWHQWRAFDPVRVTAFPSTLEQMILADENAARSIRSCRLKAVFLTGEITFPHQRKTIESALGVPVIQNYGVQEAGAVAFECERGSWHLTSESMIVEFIRQGRRALPGELAEVVVTSLENSTMPLIRYCTGDIVCVEESRCDCGRSLPVMPAIRGRASDFLLADGGGWIEPRAAIESLNKLVEDGRLQLRQSADGSVDVLVQSQLDHCTGLGIRDGVARLVGGRSACRVSRVARLERTEFGKCRLVQSELTRRGIASPPYRDAVEEKYDVVESQQHGAAGGGGLHQSTAAR